jgi:hypothetical protein
MDWASVVSIAITGLVGIAGVAGTILAAGIASKSATKDLQLSISAENDRVNKAEKRRIYAGFQTSVESMLRATVKDGEAAEPEKKEARAGRDKAEIQMALAFNELELIAPYSVERSAWKVVTHFVDYVYGQQAWIDKFAYLQEQSIDAMRADLNEPALFEHSGHADESSR